MTTSATLSTRSGHVDVNERRLRPIYGQHTLTVKETRTAHAYIYRFHRILRTVSVDECCMRFVLCKSRFGPTQI